MEGSGQKAVELGALWQGVASLWVWRGLDKRLWGECSLRSWKEAGAREDGN
jgi:hypothetical protein